MRENTLLYLTILVTCLTSVLIAEKPPNIILVLADDLGYSDAGCFGGDVQTPNLDSLAESGLRFTQMYSTGRCWPSRAVLMTGYYAQQVGMDPRRGKEWPSWSRLLPLRLKEIGRVMAQVKTMREADNTVFIFVSDNGASGEMMNRGDKHDPAAPLGSAGSYLGLGPGWSTAANAPFSFHKHWNHEGGISSPMVVNWPRGIRAHGELRHTSSHFIDLFPTILDLAGVLNASQKTGPDLPGRSLVPVFKAEQSWEDRVLFWAHSGNRALREGDWKAVMRRDNEDRWELYNMNGDRGELHDLAEDKPEILNRLTAAWIRLRDQYDSDFDTGAIP